MTLSCRGKAKDSEECCFALHETSDVLQNRTNLPIVKRLEDMCCIYMKTVWRGYFCQFSVVTTKV